MISFQSYMALWHYLKILADLNEVKGLGNLF